MKNSFVSYIMLKNTFLKGVNAMQLSQLKYFQAVCMFGSTLRASEILYVSQPSISSAITKLEQEFGVALFDRSGKRLTITEEGKYFLDRVNTILDELEDLESTMHRRGNPDIFYISIPPVVNELVPKLLHKYQEQHPRLKMKIYEDIQEEVVPLIIANQRDIAITVTDSITSDELETTPLMSAELFLYARKDNPLVTSGRRSVRVQDLAEIPLIMFKNNYHQTILLDEQFGQAGIEPNVILYASQFSTIQTYIKNGHASGCLLGKHEDDPDIAALAFDPPIHVNIGLLKKRSILANQNIQSLTDYLRGAFKQMEAAP